MFGDASQLLEEFERNDGLAWLVRGLLVVGRDAKSPAEAIVALENFQSLVARIGNAELHAALDKVKRDLPGYQAYVETQLALLPPEFAQVAGRIDAPDATDEEREQMRRHASEWFAANLLGRTGEEFTELMTRLASPSVPEAEKQQIRERISADLGKTMGNLKAGPTD